MDVHKEEDLEKVDIDGHGGVGKMPEFCGRLLLMAPKLLDE